jgi:hypothetical protein
MMTDHVFRRNVFVSELGQRYWVEINEAMLHSYVEDVTSSIQLHGFGGFVGSSRGGKKGGEC